MFYIITILYFSDAFLSFFDPLICERVLESKFYFMCVYMLEWKEPITGKLETPLSSPSNCGALDKSYSFEYHQIMGLD